MWLWRVGGDMKTGWKLKVLNQTMTVWSLAFCVTFAIWILSPKKPGVVYADPLYPCMVVAAIPAWLTLTWSNIKNNPWFREH